MRCFEDIIYLCYPLLGCLAYRGGVLIRFGAQLQQIGSDEILFYFDINHPIFYYAQLIALAGNYALQGFNAILERLDGPGDDLLELAGSQDENRIF